MQNQKHRKSERDFYRVVQISSALSLGILAAFLYSVREINPNIRIEFSFGSAVAFALAAVASWIFWRNLPLGEPGQLTKSRRWRVLISAAVLVLGMIGFFGYGLRNVSGPKLREIIEGTFLAVALVTFMGWVLWKLVRLIQADHERKTAARSEAEAAEDPAEGDEP